MRATLFGLDVAAVLLPSDVLTEDRVSCMEQFWNLLGEREVLVIAVSRREAMNGAIMHERRDVRRHAKQGDG